MSTAIVWFRRDLRLGDQPALAAACARHAYVIPLYIHAPEEEGDQAPGGAQRWWLHHSLKALADSLADAGAPLAIRRGPSERALADLLAETGAEAVYWNRLYEPLVIERDRRIKARLRESRGVHAESFNAALLYDPGRRGSRQQYARLAVSQRLRRGCGPVFPDIQPGPPRRALRPRWRVRADLGTGDRHTAGPAYPCPVAGTGERARGRRDHPRPPLPAADRRSPGKPPGRTRGLQDAEGHGMKREAVDAANEALESIGRDD